ncbi:hypothetical protein GCM10009122_32910 [Fulvivirga kasyanovii]|uniref:Uncharacterized protein n=2 Tax=Cytophagales TaxID=768507 RepID=A0ABQ1M7Y8_9BACT|nr:hypothetical protein [Fulvivirga kasyanovii]MBT32376.1 hypothetical protein [Thalassovita sp.]MTI27793.1 hypothetical protein [Fulvivirga kasyanovii]GGC36420.1 hypothetical protein GCM10011506_22260 [Marivirga lumbricoides]HNP17003.1 hypothetical protein [Fulvivirga sp.]
MELHRLDGFTASGLDNVDIQDIDFESLEEGEMSGQQIEALEALGYVQSPDIAYEIQDEDGNVIMYADVEENLYVIDGLGELGFLKKIGRGLKNAAKFVGKKVIKPVAKGVSNAAKFTAKKVITPVVKTVNRYLNPATILLRNGFLLAMKTNLMKVAERLRFGYLSDSEARKRGMSMSGFVKLKEAIKKADKIYELAGGKKENLKKAILTGKGNTDKSVPLNGFELGSPLSEVDDYVDPFEKMIVEADADEVEQLLNDGMEVEGLGVVVTGTAVAAASGAVASISALLSKITGVFDKAKKTQSDVKNLVSTAKSFVPTPTKPGGGATPVKPPQPIPKPLVRFSQPTTSLVRRPATATQSPVTTKITSMPSTTPTTTALVRRAPAPSTEVQTTDKPEEKNGFFQKNKTPLLIGAGVLVAGGGIYYVVKQSTRTNKGRSKSVDGIPRDAKGRFKSTGKTKTKKKSARKKSKRLVPTALL